MLKKKVQIYVVVLKSKAQKEVGLKRNGEFGDTNRNGETRVESFSSESISNFEIRGAKERPSRVEFSVKLSADRQSSAKSFFTRTTSRATRGHCLSVPTIL